MAKENAETEKKASTGAKATYEAAKAELKAFMKENKIKEDTEVSDKKIRKAYEALQAKVDETKAAWKKEKGSSSGRRTQYEYPADVKTKEEKKKYRAAQRAAKKKAEKGEKPAKEKSAAKSEKPVEGKKKKKNTDD